MACVVQLCGAWVREVRSPNPDEEREKLLAAEYPVDLADFHPRQLEIDGWTSGELSSTTSSNLL